MFHAVEKYRLPAQILLGLIALTFVGFGASSLAAPGSDYIGEVGGIKVGSADVDDMVRRARVAGMQIDQEQAYQGLIREAYFRRGAEKLGVEVPLETIKGVIVRDPGFQENGKFSESKYRAFLQQSGMTEEALIADIRKNFALQTVQNLIQAGGIVSDAQAAQTLQLLQAPRMMRTIVYQPEKYTAGTDTAEDKLKAYYAAHKDAYKLDDAVKFDFVILSADDLAAREKISDAEIQAAYNDRPAASSEPKPALADVRDELVRELQQQKAARLLAEKKSELDSLAFNNPDSLKPVADKLQLKIESQSAWVTKKEAQARQMPEALQNALFAKNTGDKKFNSAPIQMADGVYWVVRITDVRAQHQAGFEEVREVVKKDYLAAEGKKNALAAAEADLKALREGKTVSSSWSPETGATPEQAASLMTEKDFNTWIKARPNAGKPAYVLLTGAESPVLTEITAIGSPDVSAESVQRVKMTLQRNNAVVLMGSYLKWLQDQYPLKTGKQKLSVAE